MLGYPKLIALLNSDHKKRFSVSLNRFVPIFIRKSAKRASKKDFIQNFTMTEIYTFLLLLMFVKLVLLITFLVHFFNTFLLD
jgi:hypothetical protein